jgi:outer membrane protein assembly factor BamB
MAPLIFPAKRANPPCRGTPACPAAAAHGRAHTAFASATPQAVNRSVAYLDGRVFRGTQDGRVLAYDFKSGERLWETAIADPKKSETAPAAPITWNDLVFIGAPPVDAPRTW